MLTEQQVGGLATSQRSKLLARFHKMGLAYVAEDLLQETLHQALQSRGQFSGTSAPGTWLFRIGINKAHDHLRRAGRSPVLPALVDEDGEQIAVDGEDVSNDPARRAEARQGLTIVQNAMNEVDALDQAIFRLALDAATGHEMSVKLGITPQAAQSRLSRLRKRLRLLLEA